MKRYHLLRRFNAFRPGTATVFGLLGMSVALVAILDFSSRRAASAPIEQKAGVRLRSVEPTVFFVQEKDGLLQVAEATIDNQLDTVEASLEVTLGKDRRSMTLGKLRKGVSKVQVQVPDLSEPITAEFSLVVQGEIAARFARPWQPQRHWEVCMVPITHHDLGYTDTIENVLRNYDGFYDDVLRFCDETNGWPVESRYRYTVEGAWSVLHFLKNRPEETARKLARYTQEGRIEISALLGNPVGSLCSHEEQIRSMYPSFRLKRELGAPIRTAAITDVPGLSWGIPTVLSGAGVKYFFAGLPNYFQWGRNDVHDFWNEKAVLPHGRPDAFRWEGPDGRSVLLYFQGSYGHFTGGIGPRSYDEVFKHLPGKLEAIQKQDSPLRVVRYIHNGVDNYPPDMVISRIAREWNQRWAYPKLLVATNAMFFERLDAQSRSLRTIRGELPDTDYVVGAASTPLETGINRMTHDRLHAAEKFATMASLLTGYPGSPDKKFWITTHTHYPDVNRAIGEAYENAFLFDEHTWGMCHQAGRQQDWDWSDKSRYAYKAAGMAESILEGSLGAIADRVKLGKTGPHLVVFNPLSVPRTDLVIVSSKRFGFSKFFNFADEAFTLIDEASGKETPCQVVTLAGPQAPAPYAAQRYARGQFNRPELHDLAFVAEDVPPMGWKTYRMVPGKKTTPAASGVIVGDTSLESGRFKLTLDPQTGAVASLLDKELSKELIDRDAPYRLNQLVVRWVKSGQKESPLRATVQKGANGPVYGSLVVSTAAPGCPQVTQEVILYDKLARIDLANRVLKDSTPALELYFTFPFKMDRPEFHFEGSNSVIKPLRDQFPGSNSNYYAVQHWANVNDGQVGVTLSAVESHLLEFGGLWPCYVSQAHHGVTPPDFGRPFVKQEELTKGHMVAFAMDANFRTNFPPLQAGDLLFRYSIAPHRGTWKEGVARNFGWSVGNPLVAVAVDGKKEGTLAPYASFCQVQPANAWLLTLKRAEDGDGWIIRLMETEGAAVSTIITFPHLAIRKAWTTNLVEENQAESACSGHEARLPLAPFGISTLRIRTD